MFVCLNHLTRLSAREKCVEVSPETLKSWHHANKELSFLASLHAVELFKLLFLWTKENCHHIYIINPKKKCREIQVFGKEAYKLGELYLAPLRSFLSSYFPVVLHV
jgi:hypothetical protein